MDKSIFFKHIDLTIPLAVSLSQSIQRKNLQFLNFIPYTVRNNFRSGIGKGTLRKIPTKHRNLTVFSDTTSEIKHLFRCGIGKNHLVWMWCPNFPIRTFSDTYLFRYVPFPIPERKLFLTVYWPRIFLGSGSFLVVSVWGSKETLWPLSGWKEMVCWNFAGSLSRNHKFLWFAYLRCFINFIKKFKGKLKWSNWVPDQHHSPFFKINFYRIWHLR
jgi:hypothetical protein